MTCVNRLLALTEQKWQIDNCKFTEDELCSLLFTFLISPFTFRTKKIPKLKSLNSKSSLRIPQSLNLFLSAVHDSTVQQSTTIHRYSTTALIFFIFPSSTASFSPATMRTRVHTTTSASLQYPPGKLLCLSWFFSPYYIHFDTLYLFVLQIPGMQHSTNP